MTQIVRSSADLQPAGVGGYAKAIWAGFAAGVVAFGAAITVATPDGVTATEWITCGSAFVVAAAAAGYAAYLVKNDVVPVAVVASGLGSTLFVPVTPPPEKPLVDPNPVIIYPEVPSIYKEPL